MTYDAAKECARILTPLVGKSLHYVQNVRDLVKQIKVIRLEEDKFVEALFISVPVDPTIKIKEKLEQDKNSDKAHQCLLERSSTY